MGLYGLIGYPLGHSFSKKYFTKKFENETILDCRYELFPLLSINDLPNLVSSTPNLKGLNVTIPYKKQVLKYVTEASDSVKEIGAANTLKIEEGKLIAYNTDVIGFKKSFVKKIQPSHKKALVLGTGGASKAVIHVLQNLGIEFLLVSRNQQPENGRINYSMIDERIIKDHQVIINCTPAGMYPNDKEYPELPYQFISKEHYLFDLIYKPEKTWFLKKGEAKGAVIENGFQMLIIQAEESWKIWTEG